MRLFHTALLLFFTQIVAFAQLTIATTTTESRCSADGSITVNVSGGTAPYTYSLTGVVNRTAQSTNRFLALPRGNYTVTVVDAANQTQTATVSVSGTYAPPTLSVVVNQSTATAMILGGRPPFKFTYQRDGIVSGDTSNTGLFKCLANGNYRFQVIDSCNNFYPFDAVVNIAALSFSTTCGVSVGLPRITVSAATGGTAPYFYFCRSNLGRLDSNATGVFNNLQGCSFDVTMRDACGKTLVKTVDCAGDPLSIKVVCSNASLGTATVNVTGGTLPYSVLTETNSGKTAVNGVFTNLPLKKKYRFEVKDACNRLFYAELDTFRIFSVLSSGCPFDSTISIGTTQSYYSTDCSFYCGNFFDPVTYRCLNCPPSVPATVLGSTYDRGIFKRLPEGTYNFEVTNACGERIVQSVNLKKTSLTVSAFEYCNYISASSSAATKYYFKIGNTIVDSNATGRFIPTKPNQTIKIIAISPDCGSDSTTITLGFTATATVGCDSILVLPCPSIGNYRFDLKNAAGQIVATSTTGLFKNLTNSTTYTCEITHVPSGERLATPLSIITKGLPKLLAATLGSCSVQLEWDLWFYTAPVGTIFQAYNSANQLVATSTTLFISGLSPNTNYRIVAVHPTCGTSTINAQTNAVSPPNICVIPSSVSTGTNTCEFGWDIKINPNTADLVLKNIATGNLPTRSIYSFYPTFSSLTAGKYLLTRGGCTSDTIDLPSIPEDYLKLTAPPSCPQSGRIVATGGYKVADWLDLVRPKGLVFCDTSSIAMIYYLKDSTGRTLYESNGYTPIQSKTGVFNNLTQGKLYQIWCGIGSCAVVEKTRVPLYVRSILAAIPASVCNGATSGDLTATMTNGSAPYTFEIRETGARIVSDSPKVIFRNLPLGNYTLRAYDFCQISTDFAVAVAPLSITTNFADRRCSDSVRLNATPVNGAIYVWKNSSGQIIGNTNSIFINNNNNSTQNYTATVTVGTCQILENLTVPAMTEPPFFSNAGNDTTLIGLSVRLNGNGVPSNGSGFWQALSSNPSNAVFGNNLLSNASVSVSVAGRYGFVWTVNSGVNGCISTDTVFVVFVKCSQSSLLSITRRINLPTTCDASGSIKISIGTSNLPFRFLWSNGATTDSVNRLLAGTYQVTISDADICTPDTVLSIVLAKPVFSSNLDTSICRGTVFRLDTFSFSTAGLRQILLKTKSGSCDSTVNLTLRLRRVDSIVLTKNLCFGQNFKLGDSTILTSGVYQKTFRNTEGCDSTVRLSAFFQQKTDSMRVQKTCNPTAVGLVTVTFKNRFGCDSLVLTTQTVLSRRDSIQRVAAICKGDSLRFGTVLLKNQGIFTQNFKNTEGCDSTEIMTLTVNKPDTIRRTETTCDVTAVGTRRDTFQNIFGCLSLIFTTKTFSPKDSSSRVVFTCDSTKVGQENTLFQNRLGCDSIITTITKLARRDLINQTKTICPGDSLRFGNIWLKNEGIFNKKLVNTEGCDSTVILDLKIKKPDTTRLAATTCDPNLVGTTSRTLRNQLGCDSTIFTILTFKKSDTTRLAATTCDPNLVGTTSRILRNQLGCDSTVFTTLTFKKSDTTRLAATTCDPNLVGTTSRLLRNQWGCDSIILKTTRLLRSDTIRLNQSICAGDSVLFNRIWLKIGGIFTQNSLNTEGCDSIRILNLTVNPKINVQTQQKNPRCTGTNDGAITLKISGGTKPFDISWSNGATDSLVSGLGSGRYAALVTDSKGCQTSVQVVLPPTDSLVLEIDLLPPPCFENKTGQIVVKKAVGRGQLGFSLDGQNYPLLVLPLKIENQSIGQHRLLLRDSTGCILEKKITLSAPLERILVVLPKDTSVILGDSFKIRTSVNFTPKNIVWSPQKSGLSCDTCLMPIVKPIENKRFIVKVSDEKGCVSQTDLIVRTEFKGVYIPNVFAPEGVNNIFTVYASSSIERIEGMKIFNRWGELVYYFKGDFQSGVTGWDGTIKGQLATPSVFVVVVDIVLKNGEKRIETGDVTLMR
jgi:hypothetical protein